MSGYFLFKFLHVIGSTVLLGTGAGIAFFFWMAHRTGRAVVVAAVARIVVIADFVFTATAVIVQPVTGLWLTWVIGIPFDTGWVVLSIALYLVAGAFWIPVVLMQIRMRELAELAARQGRILPAEYNRLFSRWFAFGFPSFGAVLAIIWLMITKPVLHLPL